MCINISFLFSIAPGNTKCHVKGTTLAGHYFKFDFPMDVHEIMAKWYCCPKMSVRNHCQEQWIVANVALALAHNKPRTSLHDGPSAVVALRWHCASRTWRLGVSVAASCMWLAYHLAHSSWGRSGHVHEPSRWSRLEVGCCRNSLRQCPLPEWWCNCRESAWSMLSFSRSGLLARVLFVFSPVRLSSQGSLCLSLSRESLREMDGCAPPLLRIEVMRKWAPFSNTCANCAAESAVDAVGSMFSVTVRDS